MTVHTIDAGGHQGDKSGLQTGWQTQTHSSGLWSDLVTTSGFRLTVTLPITVPNADIMETKIQAPTGGLPGWSKLEIPGSRTC